ncbi:hypothetical protein C0583_03740 [Candidatus Parcubacteria bacterium]|nr:MAG: hypothetical protein C0583_03740 [Candidatus Parcubacteria bacterium]
MRNKKLPYRFHIGTQKAGSTYLYNLLLKHPDVGLSEMTEVNFFSREFEKGYDYYSELFPQGEAIDMTPKYFMLGGTVAPRIKKYADEFLEKAPKFLLILRNPIDYLNSHFEMQKIQISEMPEVENLLDYVKKNPGYLKRAKYYEILTSSWLKYFDKSQFRIIEFSDFVKNKDERLNEILDFWNLKQVHLEANSVSENRLLKYSCLHKVRGFINESVFLKKFLKKNRVFGVVYKKWLTKKSKNILSPEERLQLREMLKNDVDNLKKLFNRDFKYWQDFN